VRVLCRPLHHYQGQDLRDALEPFRRRMRVHGAGVVLGPGVSDQQEDMDQLLRPFYRGAGHPDAGRPGVPDRVQGQTGGVDPFLRRLWEEPLVLVHPELVFPKTATADPLGRRRPRGWKTDPYGAPGLVVQQRLLSPQPAFGPASFGGTVRGDADRVILGGGVVYEQTKSINQGLTFTAIAFVVVSVQVPPG